jgi:hypothetical protein
MLYITKWGCLKARVVQRPTLLTVPGHFLFPSPVPPRKKSTTHPKMSPHQIFHHQCTVPGIDPIGKPPSVNPVYRTHVKDSHPKPGSEHALTPSRTRLSIPLAIAREHRRARSNSLPRRNATAMCARAMDQDYPFTGPSPGTNPSIYSSSLPRVLGKLSGNILPKDIKLPYVLPTPFSSVIRGPTTTPPPLGVITMTLEEYLLLMWKRQVSICC